MSHEVSALDRRVLGLTPTPGDQAAVGDMLRQAGLSWRPATTTMDLRQEMARGGAMVIAGAAALNSEALAALQERLRQDPEWSDWPFIVLAPVNLHRGTQQSIAQALDHVVFVPWPSPPDFLLSVVHSVTRDRNRQYELRRIASERDPARDDVVAEPAKVEAEVAKRTRELRESVKSLEGFCYTVAHDLRAPLRAMQGLATALLEDYGEALQGEGHNYATRIVSAAARMDRLIQDLLAYGRLGQLEVTLAELKLDAAVDASLASQAPEIRCCHAQVTVQRPLPVAWSHQLVLEQVLSGLLSNSLKFVAPGVKPEVNIRAEEKTRAVRLWVEDNGIGIESRHHERIFKVFERLHGEEIYPGTGIGLALVQKGVQRLGGRVGLESHLGAGSRFWVELPRQSGDIGPDGLVLPAE